MRFFGRPKPAEVEERSDALVSIGDPRALQVFELAGARNDARMHVSAATSMGMTAVYRAVSLIAGAIAGLPLKTYEDTSELRQQVPSFLDDPGTIDDFTPFELKEYLMVSLLLHGNAYAFPRRNGAGATIGLQPIAPAAVAVDLVGNERRYRVTMASGAQQTYFRPDIIHIRALSTDGIVGLSPIAAARQSIGTGLAADKTAAKQFGNGMLIGGLVTPKENLPEEEAKAMSAGFNERMGGHDNAGTVRFVNRELVFSPWTMNAKDAQFIESRSFQVEEIARLFGLPVILLADATKTTSWGAGVAEVIRATQKFTFSAWTSRIEERLSKLLPPTQFCEFDYAGLLEGSTAEVTANLVQEIEAGLLTKDEGRRILNRPPAPIEETPA